MFIFSKFKTIEWEKQERKKDRKNEEMRWKADYQLSVNVKGCSKRGNTFAEMFV